MKKDHEEKMNLRTNRQIQDIAADYAARVFLSTDKEEELKRIKEELNRDTNRSGISNGIYAKLINMLEDTDN